jgi:hypothetical protein
VRTSHKTVTFTRPFSSNGIDEVQPAGNYTAETDEDLLPDLSVPAWRRIATLIFLPSRPGGAFMSGWSTLIRWSWKQLRKEMPHVHKGAALATHRARTPRLPALENSGALAIGAGGHRTSLHRHRIRKILRRRRIRQTT